VSAPISLYRNKMHLVVFKRVHLDRTSPARYHSDCPMPLVLSINPWVLQSEKLSRHKATEFLLHFGLLDLAFSHSGCEPHPQPKPSPLGQAREKNLLLGIEDAPHRHLNYFRFVTFTPPDKYGRLSMLSSSRQSQKRKTKSNCTP